MAHNRRDIQDNAPLKIFAGSRPREVLLRRGILLIFGLCKLLELRQRLHDWQQVVLPGPATMTVIAYPHKWGSVSIWSASHSLNIGHERTLTSVNRLGVAKAG